MAGIDNAAIGWTIAIVIVGVGIAVLGSNANLDSLPSITLPDTSNDKIAAAKNAILDEQKALEKMKNDTDMMDKDMEMDDTMKMDDDMEMDKDMEMDDTMKMDDEMSTSEPQTHEATIPDGAGLPTCVENDACYDPTSFEINAGDTVIWTNADIAIHTVTYGDLKVDSDLVGNKASNGFDSGLITAKGSTFSFTFESTGEYPYFCTLHPWMTGTVIVN